MSGKRGTCLHCGKDRWIMARGLCSTCYKSHRDEYPTWRRTRPPEGHAPIPRGSCSACGRDGLAIVARGLCATCYRKRVEAERTSTSPRARAGKTGRLRTSAKRIEALAARVAQAIEETLDEYIHVEEVATITVEALCEKLERLEETNRELRLVLTKARADSLGRWKRLAEENAGLRPLPKGTGTLDPPPTDEDGPEEADTDPLELDDEEDES